MHLRFRIEGDGADVLQRLVAVFGGNAVVQRNLRGCLLAVGVELVQQPVEVVF